MRRIVGKAGAVLAGWLAPLTAVLLLAGALAVLSSEYLNCARGINRDDFLCPDECQDVLDGRSLEGWHLPGAPYLFPDDLLLLACQGVCPHLGAAVTLYTFVFYFALVAGLAWLARLAGLPGRQAFLAACVGVLLLVVTHLGDDYQDRATLMAHPGNHVGAVLVGVLTLAMLLRGVRDGLGEPGAAALALVVAFGTFSDKLLALQFLAPAGGALVVLAVRRAAPLPRLALALALMAAGFALSLAIKALMVRHGLMVLNEEAQFRWFRDLPWRATAATLLSFVRGQTLLRHLLPLHLAVALGLALFWRRPAGPAPLFLAVFVLLLPALNVGALLATGKTDPAVGRYLLAALFAPLLFLGLLLAAVPGRAARAAGALGTAAVLLFAGWRVADLGPGAARRGWRLPYPPLAQTLDRLVRERGPLRGLGGYWAARGMNYLSREHVRVNAFMGAPCGHGLSPDCFLAEAPDDANVPDFRFVVVDSHLRPEFVLPYFGEPAERVPTGGGEEVWLYDAPLDSDLFDRFLAAQVARRYRRGHAWTGPAWPPTLARPRHTFSPADDRHNLRLGPWATVEVRFDPPVTGTLIDLGADYADRYDLEFFAGPERLATLRAPAVPWTGTVPAYGPPGIQPRLLTLPAVLRERPWDRVVVTTRPGGTGLLFSLAHFLVYHDEPPRLTARPAPAPTAPRRFEAEALPTEAGAASKVADPGAGGGAARRCGADFAGCLSYSPYLTLPPGRHRVDFTLKVDDTAAPAPLATLEVTSEGGANVLARRELGGADVSAPGRYETHSLLVETADEREQVTFRLLAHGRTRLALDSIELTPLPPRPDGAVGGPHPRTRGRHGCESPSTDCGTSAASPPPAWPARATASSASTWTGP
jgi:hypothetical protein